MSSIARSTGIALTRSASFGLLLLVVVTFSCLSPKFLAVENFVNILIQATPIAIAAVGMTFVLLTAGIDLSVGSIIFLAGAVGGSLVVRLDIPVGGALLAMLFVAFLCGVFNGIVITWLGLSPFIVTLATLFVARGLGLWITETRAINLPETFLLLAAVRPFSIPLPVWILVAVVVVAQYILSCTPFGRQLYALGVDPFAAQKAGLAVNRITLAVYVICAVMAGVGGIIALAQLAAVSPNLGQGRELDVIAAAVLGGASLFGGRGTALGAVFGALIIETVRNGLNLVDADPYIYPIVTGAIIFIAVLLDSLAHRQMSRLMQRRIRPLSSEIRETSHVD